MSSVVLRVVWPPQQKFTSISTQAWRIVSQAVTRTESDPGFPFFVSLLCCFNMRSLYNMGRHVWCWWRIIPGIEGLSFIWAALRNHRWLIRHKEDPARWMNCDIIAAVERPGFFGNKLFRRLFRRPRESGWKKPSTGKPRGGRYKIQDHYLP